MTWADRLIARAIAREPDFVIGGLDRPYLLRWWLIPRNPILNVYLHEFRRSDDDRALHTHPFLWNVSLLLRGGYREHMPEGFVYRPEGSTTFRWGAAPHRVELTTGPCWTLFVTGPRVRKWHFLCPQGRVHWKDFTSPADKGSIGKGCDQ